jgi:hypothetical protein
VIRRYDGDQELVAPPSYPTTAISTIHKHSQYSRCAGPIFRVGWSYGLSSPDTKLRTVGQQYRRRVVVDLGEQATLDDGSIYEHLSPLAMFSPSSHATQDEQLAPEHPTPPRAFCGPLPGLGCSTPIRDLLGSLRSSWRLLRLRSFASGGF